MGCFYTPGPGTYRTPSDFGYIDSWVAAQLPGERAKSTSNKHRRSFNLSSRNAHVRICEVNWGRQGVIRSRRTQLTWNAIKFGINYKWICLPQHWRGICSKDNRIHAVTKLLWTTSDDCQFCCFQNSRCGNEEECSQSSVTFLVALISIIVLLVIILVTWCFFIHKRNVNQKNRFVKRMMESELKHQARIKRQGVSLSTSPTSDRARHTCA